MILHISNNEYDYHTLLKSTRMAGLAGIVGILSTSPMEKAHRRLSRTTRRVCRI